MTTNGTTAASAGLSAGEVAGRVSAWWRSGGRGGSAAYVVAADGADSETVMRRVHADIPGSVLVDVAGLTAEQAVQEILTALGVASSCNRRYDWQAAAYAWPEERLLLLANTRRAGHTRRSYEPEQLVRHTMAWLPCGKLAVLTDTSLELLPRGLPAETVFRLAEPGPADDASEPELPAAVRALALAEPRIVPLPVWSELVAASTGESLSADELIALAREQANVLSVGPLGVSFADEAIAEALRRQVDPDEFALVNRHLVEWLLRTTAALRHPQGWARAGAVGLYAATGLAMHAVQAGTYNELMRDGRTVAHLPQTALMDSARSRSFIIPGDGPAGDAVHLWNWGVVPRSQGEWASWLHLMAWSRDDFAFASAVAASGVALPWVTKWAHWRPPGGYHHRFLEAGRFGRLTEVRWRGRPAVAGFQSRMVDESLEPYVTVRDGETGELVAGPWDEEEIPPEQRADLALPSATGTAADAGSEHPTRLVELFASSSAPRDEGDFVFRCTPLVLGDVVVLGGVQGLIALQAADGVGTSDVLAAAEAFGSRRRSLSHVYADAGPSRPVDAPPPHHSDLISLFGKYEVLEAEPEELPDGLTHAPTRELLTGFGLPDMKEGAMRLMPCGDWDVTLLEEVEWPDDVERVAESGPFFMIGRWMGGEIVIDGPTGHILRVPTGPGEEYLAGLPAARDLESFLTMVALYVAALRTRGILPPVSTELWQIPYWASGALSGVDEAGSEQPAWAYMLHNM